MVWLVSGALRQRGAVSDVISDRRSIALFGSVSHRNTDHRMPNSTSPTPIRQDDIKQRAV